MLFLQQTDSDNQDFQQLVAELDKELAKRNGATNDFYVQYNGIDQLKYVVLAWYNDVPVGCGAIKPYDAATMEVKRMFVVNNMRGKGVAAAILAKLENWAKTLGYAKCVLETGDKMPEAIQLYKKSGYTIIPNYGQYAHVAGSICFEKYLDITI